MYGFVEPWITELLDVQFDAYNIGDGLIANIVSADNFERILHIFLHIFSDRTNIRNGKNSIERPIKISSNVIGMHLLLMRYWINEDILYALTDGQIKARDSFVAFMEMPNPRFNLEHIKDMFIRIAMEHRFGLRDGIRLINTEETHTTELTDQHDAIDDERGILAELRDQYNIIDINNPNVGVVPDALIEHVPVEQAPVEQGINIEQKVNMDKKQEKNESIKKIFIEDVITNVQKIYSLYQFTTPNNNCIICDQTPNEIRMNILFDLADKLNKNIIMTLHYNSAYLKIIKKSYNTKEVEQHTLFIDTCPIYSSEEKKFVKLVKNSYTICMGTMTMQPLLVYGTDVNNDVNLLYKSHKTDESIEKIKNGENSPYYKYDQIFKDTYTNVVWAVKDRCVIHVLCQQCSERFMDTILIELTKRINNKLSYKELLAIDKAYFDNMNANNMDSYINFALENSKRIYDDMNNELKKLRISFNSYMSQAMETAKIAQRIEDQLSAFDMNGFEAKEKEKAIKNYKDTMGIDKVKCICIEDNKIHIYTKNLYVKDPRSKKWHDIGTFHIILGMLGKSYDTSNTIAIFNTKYNGMGMNNDFQAPHVYGDGHVCHGNMAASMVESYKQRNLFELIYQIIIFLQSVNVGDAAGAYIHTWPEVTEDMVKRDEDGATYDEISEIEKKWDNQLAEALPIHI